MSENNYVKMERAILVHVATNAREKHSAEESLEELSSPFEEAVKAGAYYIDTVYDFSDFVYLTVENLATGKNQALNKRALAEIGGDEDG